MRAAAQIEPFALAIDGDGLVGRQVADQLGLETLATCLEKRDGLVAVPFLAGEGRVGGDDLLHLRFDGRQVIGRERLVAGEIVIEAVFDGGADGHLRAGIERLHRLGEHMRRVVADEGQRRVILAGDEFD